MATTNIFDADQVLVAIEKTREYAQDKGLPFNKSRLALYLGVTSAELDNLLNGITQLQGDEETRGEAIRLLKMANQESEADLVDRINERKSQPGGPIFLAKALHRMIETTHAEVTMKGVRFTNEENIPD